ncbi:MAG: FixH family protein [Beijerinckiaceae bacterium]|nr:FixH family protein [Beijerinckiaceae bacterium]MCZ8299265.1 FixH family protein [Beijerinckiaceae bacterium]
MPVEIPDLASAPAREPFRLTGHHVLVIFLAFFGIVAGVNGYMMRQALQTMPGLDARNGYDVSQRYNAELAAAAEQDRRGWKTEIRLDRKGSTLELALSLADRDLRPVSGQRVRMRFAHPASRQLDREVTLSETGRGRYSGAVPGMAAGHWSLILTIEDPAENLPLYTSRNRIELGS